MPLFNGPVDKKWTLFLDRDGVLNERLPGDYVRQPDAFAWKEGAREGLAALSPAFGQVVVVTNQQGIGKGLMDTSELDNIHRLMLEQARAAGGRIDKVYFCGDLKDSGSVRRKPAVGMGLQARKDFPGIRFSQSVMVGDTISDMRFGRRLGMITVLIDPRPDTARRVPALVDLRFHSLQGFAHYLQEQGLLEIE
jgi:histidinol-phosphate phosphatase family protein